ncbi:MAG: hypothetical protein L6R42_006973 [Xanthoria sp. 1 TBL-2021]|nr:MAG: hypothetical protein L6R42_006973 [Xanthoria sp. 1 TBL-2021]
MSSQRFPPEPPPGANTTLPPSSPIAPTSPSHPSSTIPTPPFRPIFLTLLVACPLLAVLPPRKLDLYTFMLGAAWVVSAEELTLGSSRLQSQQQLHSPFTSTSKPQDADQQSIPLAAQSQIANEIRNSASAPEDLKHRLQERERQETGVAGLARRLWYGSEREDWKEKRIREEKEALEEGRGYGGLIGDAVREAFGGSVEREDVERFNAERARGKEGGEAGRAQEKG